MIHVGKNKNCQELKVNGHTMKAVDSDTYLGDIISNDGKNNKNIQDRVSKGMGLVSQIFDVLKNLSLGKYYFSIALTLREAILINGMLFNCEVWYGLTRNQIERLESIDILFLRKLFNVTFSCPTEALFLETGCLPLRFIIASRRLNYLHNLASRQPSEMLSKFFQAQWADPCKNDWSEQVKIDLKSYGLSEDLSEISKFSKSRFKEVVKLETRGIAFTYLMSKKKLHSKLNNLQYCELKTQPYLKQEELTVSQARIIFKSRCRMTVYWENYKGWNLEKSCPVCKITGELDSQGHSFSCSVVVSNIKVAGSLEDIFKEKMIDLQVVKTVENIEKFREEYLMN